MSRRTLDATQRSIQVPADNQDGEGPGGHNCPYGVQLVPLGQQPADVVLTLLLRR